MDDHVKVIPIGFGKRTPIIRTTIGQALLDGMRQPHEHQWHWHDSRNAFVCRCGEVDEAQ